MNTTPTPQSVRTALFPGSFDPFTLGHAQLVERALVLFDRIVIAIGCNDQKRGCIPVDERVTALQALYHDEPRIQVVSYNTLTVQLARQMGATAILRGVRNTADFLYEQEIAEMNRQLTGIETVLLFTQPELAHVSSSMVRELARYGQDITPFLPKGLSYESLTKKSDTEK